MAQETGEIREGGQEAHHMVAAKDFRAMKARAILENVGMDVNSSFNGVFLDSSYHRPMHTDAYYESVNVVLTGASSYMDVVGRLSSMRVRIIRRDFP